MNQLRRLWVHLSRLHRSRGFGIQSPTDYALVCYVINEHWPYYAYGQLTDNDWLTQKRGRLYFRLANWRRPERMVDDEYRKYWQAGCHRIRFVPHTERVELARLGAGQEAQYEQMLAHCDEHSVLVVEDIWRTPEFWHRIEKDPRTGTTFDLYYCGIVLFDKKRFKHNYTINF